MPVGPNRLRSSTMTGLLMAVAATLIVTGVVLFVAIGNRSGPRPAALPGAVIDIGQAPKGNGAVQDITAGVPTSGAARLQFADKKDPQRLQSEMAFEKLDPVGNGYYALSQPRAWIYMRDGRILYITAAAGRVKMPGKAQQPESGEFTGGVVIRMYTGGKASDPARPVDPDLDAPGMLATTQTLSFDTALLELSTEDPVTISTPSLLFKGVGLLVRGNEVKERIEFLKTRGEMVRYNPKMTPDHARKTGDNKRDNDAAIAAVASAPTSGVDLDAAPAAESAGDAPTAVAAAPEPATAAPRETMYKAVASGRVRLAQTSRSLAADTLEIWSRVIDNRLPDNAFAPLEFVAADASTTPAPTGTPVDGEKVAASNRTESAAADTAPAPASGTSPLFVSAGDGDIVLTWSGPLVLAPIGTSTQDTPPDQLAAGNHFAARFSAERESGERFVRMTDTHTGTAAACTSIEYLATARTLRLLSGAGVDWVMLSSPGAGRFLAPSLLVNLGNGLGHVHGAGSLISIGAGANPALAADPEVSPDSTALEPGQSRRITWAEQADFQFRGADGKLTSALEWAAFTGSVLAQDRSSVIGGDFLRAEFEDGKGKNGKPITSLKKLKVQGNVLAVAGSGKADALLARNAGPTIDPFVAADSLEVSFAPVKGGPDDVEPSFATALGRLGTPGADGAGTPMLARVGSPDATLSAAKIETRFGRDERGNLTATDVIATASAPGASDATVERRDGSVAYADRIRADGRGRSAELTGEKVRIGRGASTIAGTKMRLDDARAMLIVDGPGTFEHLQVADAPLQFADASGTDGRGSASVSRTGDGSATRVTATWNKGMAFDNKRGEITCEGQSVVVAAGPLSTQTLKSEKLVLNITPDPGTPAGSAALAPARPGADGPPIGPDGRKLLRADAIGSIVSRADGQNATVEVRRYSSAPAPSEQGPSPSIDPAAPTPGRILEQVMYIEGPRIISDEVTAMMTIPAAGRAVVRDQRAGPNEGKAAAIASPTPAGAGSGSGGAASTPTTRGTSGFTWAGSMDFNRTTGVVTMRKDVELVHVTLDGQQKTRMVAGELAATFATGGRAGVQPSAGSQRTDMVRAEASGAVYAESGPMRLVTDRFSYDAQSGTAQAQAAPGNRVTLYDDRKATPIVARKLFWDIARDRVEVTEPAPMVAPR